MDRKTGMYITIALAVVFGCCALFSCFGGVATLAGGGTFETTGFDGVTQTGQMSPATGLVGICMGIIFLAIPVIAYFVLVRNKPETPSAPPPAM